MLDPKKVAEDLLGPITWESSYSGHCHCPGESLHTTKTVLKACRIRIDGVPTLYCFHSHCKDAVAAANSELRSRLASEDWTLLLPGGRVLSRGQWASPPPRDTSPLDKLLVQVEEEMHARKDRIFSDNAWPLADIIHSSPISLIDRPPEDHFRHWLLLWPADSIVWIGNVQDSGRPEAATHFRPIGDWYEIGPVMGSFTCPSAFHPGTTSRSDASVLNREFLVVESDTLDKDQVGAVFRWLTRRVRMPLHAIVDTAGKSLHGWFSSPPPEKEIFLKIALAALGCDTSMFNRSQPVRLPGAWRQDKLQKLIWISQ
jgi:hypothetical protein